MHTPLDSDFRTIHRELHRLRLRWLLWIGSALLCVLGLGWGVFFAFKGAWVIVAIHLGMLGVGVITAVWTQRNRTRAAFFLFMLSMFVVICAVSLTLDVPTAQVPRSIHLFLLVLAMTSILFLCDDVPTLRYGISSVCCAAFLVLASSRIGISAEYVLPEGVRIWGSWFNNLFSALGLYLIAQVMVSEFTEHSLMELDLRKGIAKGEFFLLFQPQVNSRGQVFGAEALLRWRQPKRGLVGPNEFIPVAEQTGLILPLGSWVLHTACLQLVEWSGKPAMRALTLSVNVSVHQIRQSDFVQQVQSVIERTGACAQRLKLELTESSLVQDMEDIIDKMVQLKAMGVGFSLDDFGTGYSSLSYLKRLPLDQLKIDQSFVRDVLTDANDAAIARMLIGLGDTLHFSVIAEGVETVGHQEFLMRNGCHLFQGYLFSKPIDALALELYAVDAVVANLASVSSETSRFGAQIFG